MVVNHGGALSKEYFISYLKLIMNARSFTLEEAEWFMFKQFFSGKKDTFGKESYTKFLEAIEDLRV
ncbi:hypothetical protein [Bacillus sp. PK3_68]|uniref:hypothetical protein n=1 Tax=Bacillus sp. PK3_68 TaxID=2027408 RepID=UPI000E72E622|nr:hypothetical protein [Bacillus sp. PK3_68]RJS59261.1 hypothetical protein CJ483_03585 [Bacillus sp. PK3_68]